ncbi:MAG: hypothetical protein ACRD9R_06520 [Pyrinomonadaceae bacterium]
MEHFVNKGFGWLCLRCQASLKPANSAGGLARFFTEGEAEERELKLSEPSLARWLDETRDTLLCPRCGTTERMKAEGWRMK